MISWISVATASNGARRVPAIYRMAALNGRIYGDMLRWSCKITDMHVVDLCSLHGPFDTLKMLANSDRRDRDPRVLETDCPRLVTDGWPRSIRRHITMAASVPVLINEPVRSHRHSARRAFKRELRYRTCRRRCGVLGVWT